MTFRAENGTQRVNAGVIVLRWFESTAPHTAEMVLRERNSHRVANVIGRYWGLARVGELGQSVKLLAFA